MLRPGAATASSEPGSSSSVFEPWFDSAKGDLLASRGWDTLSRMVYGNVKTKLRANDVPSFSELSDEEKALFVDEVEKELSDEPVYRGFARLVRSRLAVHLGASVEAELVGHRFTGSDAGLKVDLIQQKASTCAARLLSGLNGDKQMTRSLINHELPGPLRRTIWAMALQHAAARADYEALLETSRVSTISKNDMELGQTCQGVLDKDFPALSSVTDNGRPLLMVMKTVLSYHHVVHRLDADWLVYAMVPIVCVFVGELGAASGGEGDLALLGQVVGAFFALLEMPRPRLILPSMDANEARNNEALASALHAQLGKRDAELLDHIMEIVHNMQAPLPAAKGAATPAARAKLHIAILVERCVERLFVGVLNLETTLFVWDQGLLVGFDAVVSEFAAMLLILLRGRLRRCQTWQQLVRVVNYEAKSITLASLKTAAEQWWLPNLRDQLGVPPENDVSEALGTALFDGMEGADDYPTAVGEDAGQERGRPLSERIPESSMPRAPAAAGQGEAVDGADGGTTPRRATHTRTQELASTRRVLLALQGPGDADEGILGAAETKKLLAERWETLEAQRAVAVREAERALEDAAASRKKQRNAVKKASEAQPPQEASKPREPNMPPLQSRGSGDAEAAPDAARAATPSRGADTDGTPEAQGKVDQDPSRAQAAATHEPSMPSRVPVEFESSTRAKTPMGDAGEDEEGVQDSKDEVKPDGGAKEAEVKVAQDGEGGAPNSSKQEPPSVPHPLVLATRRLTDGLRQVVTGGESEIEALRLQLAEEETVRAIYLSMAQMAVFKRVYTPEELLALDATERKAYEGKQGQIKKEVAKYRTAASRRQR